MFTKIKYFIAIAILMFSINSNSDEFFNYYHDINQKAITYDDWSQCVIDNFKDSFKELATISGTGFLYYMRKKGYKEAAKYVAKTAVGAITPWFTPAYIIGELAYIGGNCAYLEWK